MNFFFTKDPNLKKNLFIFGGGRGRGGGRWQGRGGGGASVSDFFNLESKSQIIFFSLALGGGLLGEGWSK